MRIGRIVRGLVAPGCGPGSDFPTIGFLARAALATVLLWRLWLAPLTAWLNAHSHRDGDILVDFTFAAALMACGGLLASITSLALGEWLADRLLGDAR